MLKKSVFLRLYIPTGFSELWFDPGWNQRSYWWVHDKVGLLTDRHAHNAESRSPPCSLCDRVIVLCRCVWAASVSERTGWSSDEAASDSFKSRHVHIKPGQKLVLFPIGLSFDKFRLYQHFQFYSHFNAIWHIHYILLSVICRPESKMGITWNVF